LDSSTSLSVASSQSSTADVMYHTEAMDLPSTEAIIRPQAVDSTRALWPLCYATQILLKLILPSRTAQNVSC